jgi:metal-responsive CopG/Arc/MetJ family transcriptional regulator
MPNQLGPVRDASGKRVFPKKVLVALPPGMLVKMDEIAVREHRTRSDLIREAMRRYMRNADLGIPIMGEVS